MALQATVHRFAVNVSDVDRGVYETLDLRVARHPSETVRFMLLRVFAYALSFEDGIAFSKGGLSDVDEAPLSVRDPTGVLLAWIDVGLPSADRLHKATKAARRVSVFTAHEISSIKREVDSREIHRKADIAVFRIEPRLLDELEGSVERHTELAITRNEGRLYVDARGKTFEGAIDLVPLVTPD